MASLNSYSEPGIITRNGSGLHHIDKEMDFLVTRANDTPIQGLQFVRTIGSDQIPTNTYKEATEGSILEVPPENNDTEDIPYVTPALGFSNTFTMVNYREGVKITRSMLEDDRFGSITKMLSGLIRAGQKKVEYSIAGLFNNGFTGTAGADSEALFSNSHPHEDPDASTWDNLETASALTHGAYSTSRTNHRRQEDDHGDPMPIMPRQLVVPAELEEEARIILGSELRSGTAQNDKNPFQDESEIFVYDWLTSITAWFLWGNLPKEMLGLLFMNKSPLQTQSVTFENPDIIRGERLRTRFATGFTTEKNLRGNAGA